MTQTPVDLSQAIKALAKENPVPTDDTVSSRLSKLTKMHDFYTDKRPTASQKQAVVFSGFIKALAYAMDIIRSHRKLTKKLAELAEVESKTN